MGPVLRAIAIGLLVVVPATGVAGCVAGDDCPSFTHIVGGGFGRTGQSLSWTMQLEELPAMLTFNQAAVPANFLEYRWAVDVDSDRDGVVDLRVALEHFVGLNAAPVTGDILSEASKDLWQVNGSLSTNVGTFTASIDGNTFRFDTTTSAAPGLVNVSDGAQSTWKTVYRSGADVEDQCDQQWP